MPLYFEKGGPEHTRETIDLAYAAAKERGIKYILFATTVGNTAREILKTDYFAFSLIGVTHAYGYAEKGRNEVPEELRKELQNRGIRVFTATHVLSGAERGLQKKFGGIGPVELLAHGLRMFSAGVKVGVEIAVMALDAGLIPFGEKVIAIGGTHRGADTAISVTPSYAFSVLDTKIHEIICKPL
jgi:hypothetical protein